MKREKVSVRGDIRACRITDIQGRERAGGLRGEIQCDRTGERPKRGIRSLCCETNAE